MMIREVVKTLRSAKPVAAAPASDGSDAAKELDLDGTGIAKT